MSFDSGVSMARGIVDYVYVMANDVGVWTFADIETHKGFWHSEVDRLHKMRIREEKVNMTIAQDCYNQVKGL